MPTAQPQVKPAHEGGLVVEKLHPEDDDILDDDTDYDQEIMEFSETQTSQQPAVHTSIGNRIFTTEKPGVTAANLPEAFEDTGVTAANLPEAFEAIFAKIPRITLE